MQTIHFRSPSGRPARLGRDYQGRLQVVVEASKEEETWLGEIVREYGLDSMKEAYRILKVFGGAK